MRNAGSTRSTVMTFGPLGKHVVPLKNARASTDRKEDHYLLPPARKMHGIIFDRLVRLNADLAALAHTSSARSALTAARY